MTEGTILIRAAVRSRNRAAISGVVLAMELIRIVDGIELPAQGDWTILPHRSGSRAARTECSVAGALAVGVSAADVRLSLSIDTIDATTMIEARLVRAEEVGHWWFAGSSTTDGSRRPVELAVVYHGVFRRHGHTSVWLTVEVPGPAMRRRRSRPLVVEVSATWPAALRAA